MNTDYLAIIVSHSSVSSLGEVAEKNRKKSEYWGVKVTLCDKDHKTSIDGCFTVFIVSCLLVCLCSLTSV